MGRRGAQCSDDVDWRGGVKESACDEMRGVKGCSRPPGEMKEKEQLVAIAVEFHDRLTWPTRFPSSGDGRRMEGSSLEEGRRGVPYVILAVGSDDYLASGLWESERSRQSTVDGTEQHARNP